MDSSGPGKGVKTGKSGSDWVASSVEAVASTSDSVASNVEAVAKAADFDRKLRICWGFAIRWERPHPFKGIESTKIVKIREWDTIWSCLGEL